MGRQFAVVALFLLGLPGFPFQWFYNGIALLYEQPVHIFSYFRESIKLSIDFYLPSYPSLSQYICQDFWKLTKTKSDIFLV